MENTRLTSFRWFSFLINLFPFSIFSLQKSTFSPLEYKALHYTVCSYIRQPLDRIALYCNELLCHSVQLCTKIHICTIVTHCSVLYCITITYYTAPHCTILYCTTIIYRCKLLYFTVPTHITVLL